jgi:hypothetical protein
MGGWARFGIALGACCAVAACSGGEQTGRTSGEAEADTLGSGSDTSAGSAATGQSESDSDGTTQGGGSESSDPDDTGQSETCEPGGPSSSALALDGVGDHVTMGVAPELGLETFTLEAWIRRDGAGSEAGTGSGGVSVVPVVAKGRGENDDTIYNCNYAFGLADEVLAADFEDAATGANHPVLGTTAVTWGQWHHVAVTYDGATWRLYLDGQLDGQSDANATPRADSIQHFAIGTAMDSAGVPAGSFAGAIDEVRVWNVVRTDAEIADAMYTTVAAGPGLLGRWALDGDDGGAPDSVGDADGTIVGDATFVDPGAVLDAGEPPTIAVTAPLDDAVVPADAVELQVAIDDAEQDAFVATFHVREVSADDDFTIVVLPDTQYYSDEDASQGGSPQYFHDQTQWVMDNREAYNILAVIHNGDIVNHGDRPEEWTIANAAMSRLEEVTPDLPDGMPYGVCAGNHDQDSIGQDGATTNFNLHFGVDRFAGRWYYGGHYASDNDENWFTFSAGSLDFVVVDLQYDTTPDPAVLAWARSVFEAHPDAFGILNTHYILGGSAAFGTQGQAIYDALRETENVHLMTCGHISAESRRSDVYQGHTIVSMLADYQGDGDGGSGFMRIWEFSPANDEVTVRSYSPTSDTWLTGEESEFTLEVDLPGAGGAFEVAAVVDPAPADAAATIDGLSAGRVYEWYATVDDCAHAIDTRVQRFTTSP